VSDPKEAQYDDGDAGCAAHDGRGVLARPEDPRERGWELIGGELIDMADPSLSHELVRMEILQTRAERLTSPLLDGFALALDNVFGQ